MRWIAVSLLSVSTLGITITSCSSGSHSDNGNEAGATSDGHEGGRGGGGGDDADAGSGDHSSRAGDESAGGSSAGATGMGPKGPDVTGEVPAELVGIWQETRASGGDYVNAFGENFSVTSGFSAQLRIAADGSYQWAHYAAGASSSCPAVNYLDQSVGSAVLRGDVLTLYPSQHEIEINDCTPRHREQGGLEPIALTIGVEDAFHYDGDLRTYRMHVEGGPQPLDLTLLVRPPLAEPEQPAPPADFSLGQEPPFQELQGLWVAAAGTDSSFFDPNTGKFYFPELNGSAHQWLRFAGDAYETAVALHNINAEGVCKADLIYYEQGNALLQVLEDVGNQHQHFIGHIRLEATAARLIVRVRECDQDDAVYQYDLPGQLSYYRWTYFTADNITPEGFTLGCDFPLSEWQSTLCETKGYSRRE